MLVNVLVGWGLLSVAGALAWARVHRAICMHEGVDEALAVHERVDTTHVSRELGPVSQHNVQPGEAA
jgi:hypothetical protein